MSDELLRMATFITAISVAINWIIQWISKLFTPHNNLEKRVDAVEKKVAKHDEILANDLLRIADLEKQNKLIMKSLLALLEFDIDNSQTNVDKMKRVREEINAYLIER